ncbi:MAG: S-layer homology domain-containing protein [Eubacteriales bacterium]
MTEPATDNFTFTWDVYSLSAGIPYTNIIISIIDAYGETNTVTYKGTFELDLMPPVITVTGDTTVWLSKGDTYIDDGATVIGANTDGVLTDASAVDTNTTGTYTVTYTATDVVGNTSTRTRTVKVVDVEPLTMGNVTVVPNSICEDSAIISSNIAQIGMGKWAAGSKVVAHGYIWSTAEIADDVDLTVLPADTFNVDLGAKADTMAFLHGLTGLTEGTLYHVRAYAETADGVVALSTQTSFTTLTVAEAAAKNYSRLSFKADCWSLTDVEKDGFVNFTVVRTGDTTSELSVDYCVQEGTAIADMDYEGLDPVTQTLTFEEGETEKTIIINLIDNSNYSSEPKTLYINLSNAHMTNDTEPVSDGVLLIVDTAALVITEDDAPTVSPPPVLSSDNQISTFTLAGVTGTINHDTGGGDGGITLTVPYGTDLTSLVPTAMTVPSNATLYPSSGTARNFTSPLVYLVQAEDGTLKRYIVEVTVAALAGDADLSSFALSGASGNIPISPAFTADSTEYSVSVDNATDQLTVTPTLSDSGVTYVVKAGGITAANPIPLSVGTTVITVQVTAADGTTAKLYTVSVTRAGSTGVSSNTNLTSLMVNTGTLNPTFNKNTTDYKMTLTNGTSTLSVMAVSEDQTSATVIRANGTIVTSGQTFTLDVGANVVSVTVTASNGQSKTYAIAVTRQEAATGGTGGTGGGGGGTGGTGGSGSGTDGTGGGTSETENINTDISDKKIKEAVNIDKNDDGGVTITLREEQFKNIIKDTKTGGSIVIPVTGDANPVKVEMNGDLFKELQAKKAVLAVESEQGTVKIPSTGFKPGTLTDIFGPSIDSKDVTVTVTLSTPSGNAEKNIAAQVEKTGVKVMMPSVILDITATLGGNSANIGESDTYMTMIVPIPEGVDPSRISTAVFVDANGGVHHVPTKVSLVGGKYCATVNTRYAGVPYSFVWNPVEFSDIANHWAENSIKDMGSRMIISGLDNGKFEPNRDITRGEFAAIIVRALGLMPGAGSDLFSDVDTSEWYCQYIQTASEYGIISGYGNGKFGPNDKITREQAMTMIARAMKITELKAGLEAADINTLLVGFGDSVQVAAYARESIAACIKTGIVSGKNGKLLAPTDEITRAEVAVIIQRLLQKSGLI